MVTLLTYHVVLKGKFGNLDEKTRKRLLAKVALHSPFQGKFTDDGTLSYTESLIGFTYRVTVYTPDGSYIQESLESQTQSKLSTLIDKLGHFPYRDQTFAPTFVEKREVGTR
jgi:hypothetical protein